MASLFKRKSWHFGPNFMGSLQGLFFRVDFLFDCNYNVAT